MKKLMLGSPEYHEAHGHGGLLYLMLNLPTSCSYGCRKCALASTAPRKSGDALTSQERTRVIEATREAGVKTLVVIGNGEPTENFELMREVIETVYTNDMTTIMFCTTNNLTREQAEFYRDHAVSIFVSLDSLDSTTYRWLTGNGDLAHILRNIAMLREVYASKSAVQLHGKCLVRLGVNVTVSGQNITELADIRAFCGDDMQFVANPPMRRGRLSIEKRWSRLVHTDTKYDRLEQAAQQFSETGGHTSLDAGVCSYFLRGISVDVDGELLTCGYGEESAGRLGNVRVMTSDQLIRHNQDLQTKFAQFSELAGHRPSCPIRDPEFQKFVELWDSKK